MKAFWNTIEKMDRATFAALDRIDRLLGRGTFRERTEQAVEHVRKPQKAITFD